MPRNFSDKSIWNLAPGFGLNNVNVATLGEVNSLFGGLPNNPVYGSQDDLGKRIIFGTTEVQANYTYTPNLGASTKLYGGIYQVVLVDSGATAANIKQGLAAFMLDADQATYGVTTADVATTPDSLNELTGVFLNAATPGNYTVIQVHGKCTVQYIATVTAVTAGSAIILSGTAGKFDALTQSGNPTFLNLYNIIGTALSLPANGALGTVLMKTLNGRY